MYCQLGDYISPIPPIKGTRNHHWQHLQMLKWYIFDCYVCLPMAATSSLLPSKEFFFQIYQMLPQRICKKYTSKKKCSWKNSLSPPSRIQVANFPALPKNQQKKRSTQTNIRFVSGMFQTGSIFKTASVKLHPRLGPRKQLSNTQQYKCKALRNSDHVDGMHFCCNHRDWEMPQASQRSKDVRSPKSRHDWRKSF